MEFRLLTVTQLTETPHMDQMVHHIVLMEIQLMTIMAIRGQHMVTLRMDQMVQLSLHMETQTITVMVLPVRPMVTHTIVINKF